LCRVELLVIGSSQKEVEGEDEGMLDEALLFGHVVSILARVHIHEPGFFGVGLFRTAAKR